MGACGPGLRPNSNAFVANPEISIPIDRRTAPVDTGPALSEQATQINYGELNKEKVNADLAKSIVEVYVAATEWDEAQGLYRMPVIVTIQETISKTSTVRFSLAFGKTPLIGSNVETVSNDGKYTLKMVCASDDCTGKVLRLKRVTDGAVAIMKNIRSEQVLVTGRPGDDPDGIPVVQHYTEVKEGRELRSITDRDGSSRSLDHLKNSGYLKNTKFKRAVDVPVLTEAMAPGISKLKTVSEKLVWVGEWMIQHKTHIPRNDCKKFVLWNLAASGYRITTEPDAHNFLTLLLDPQFKGWKSEAYTNNTLSQLDQRLRALPERHGVILQYGRGQRRYGHVSILYREKNKFVVMDASLDEHPPQTESYSQVKSLMGKKRPQMNVLFPPGLK